MFYYFAKFQFIGQEVPEITVWTNRQIIFGMKDMTYRKNIKKKSYQFFSFFNYEWTAEKWSLKNGFASRPVFMCITMPQLGWGISSILGRLGSSRSTLWQHYSFEAQMDPTTQFLCILFSVILKTCKGSETLSIMFRKRNHWRPCTACTPAVAC